MKLKEHILQSIGYKHYRLSLIKYLDKSFSE